MKYNWLNQVIPQDKRKELNDKILYLINNNLLDRYNITQQDVYNSYTGNGGLHGLNFKDFDNYYEFSKEKKIREEGQFFTSHNVCKFVMDCLKPSDTDIIGDMTGGIGNFCNFTPMEENFYLNEIDLNAIKVARVLYPNANISCEDIRLYNPTIKFDLIVGNPPYGLNFKVNREEYLSQFYYCIKANELLRPLGLLAIVIPNSFMNDEFSDKSIIQYMNNNFNFICQFDLPNNSFKQVGINSIETKVMIFQKKSNSIEDNKEYNLNKLQIELSEEYSNSIYNKYIKPLYEKKEQYKSVIGLEILRTNNMNNEEMQEFQFKVRKLLFDIKRNPNTKKYYAKANETYHKFLNQKQPDGMKYEEWQKKKLTKGKVISNLKHYLNKQHTKEKDQIKLVKTTYGLKLKGYSRKNKLQLNKTDITQYISFNDMIVKNLYPFEDKTYYNLYLKKKRKYENQNKNFKEMNLKEDIKIWLDNLTIHNYDSNEDIKLNEKQKYDVNLILQKKYSYIQWSQGSGKSLAGLSYILYRFDKNNINNAFIVAPSIAINNTWNEILDSYRIKHRTIKKVSDLNNIEEKEILLITFNMLGRLKKDIKRYLQKNNSLTLVIDEADNICNLNSKRTKTTLSCFKKYGKYKLLLSGTATRNSISELYPQLELLYNNSINMLCKCEYAKEESKITGELTEQRNKYYMLSYPPYKRGLQLFKSCHIPQKITVFGAEANTQDIYNADILKELVDKTIITRTFEDIVGKKIYDIVQHTVKFNPSEEHLYYKAINKFYEMKYLFSSTGNPRKDRMLEIIQQITLLLNICGMPQSYREYQSKEIPSKYEKACSLINSWDNERVAIGCRNVKTVNLYENLLNSKFPNRKIFRIVGNETSMKKRREICKQLEQTNNGILISTQQSLSSSMNIGFVDKVIIPELFWNDAVISQYYFRFIRFNSTRHKEVHFITYENSIESNLLQLILAKEKLNLFIKDQEIDEDELYEKYGVDFNLFDMLLRKDRDNDGKSYIRWGNQNID